MAISTVSPVSRPPKRRPGPQLPRDWQPKYIARIRQHGLYNLAAEQVGVDPTTARDWRNTDPAFHRAVEDAREVHTDTLIQDIQVVSAKANNPLALIFLLKSRRPGDFHDKAMILSATVDVNALEPETGRALLTAFLSEMRPAAQLALEQGAVLDVTPTTGSELTRADGEAPRKRASS